MEKIHGVHEVFCNFAKSLFVLFDVTAEFVNCSLLKNLENPFLRFDLQKKRVRSSISPKFDWG